MYESDELKSCKDNTEYLIQKYQLSKVNKVKLVFKNKKTNIYRLYTKGNKYIGKNCENDENMSREGYCGLCINELEIYVPNFSKTYLLINLPKPYKKKTFFKTEWKINLKDEKNKVPFLIMENIKCNTKIKKILKNCNFKIFLEILIQIINALNIAYIIYDFTHYDLHLGNLIFVNKVSCINIYKDLNNYEEIKFDFLIKIIDYEFSHFSIRGRHYGHSNLSQYKIHRNKSYPMHDIYKLFMTCCLEILKYNENIEYSLLKQIYNHFELGNEINFVEIKNKYSHFQPPSRIKNMSYSEFLNILLDIYNQ